MFTYFTIVTSVELLCTVIAAICLFKDNIWQWRSMILFLLITCLTEFGGLYIRHVYHQSNEWVYNIYTIFEVGFPSIMFAHLLNQHRKSKLLVFTGLAFTYIVFILELSDFWILKENEITVPVMSVWFVIYSLYYYYLFIKDDTYVNLKYSASFWWVTGTLIYYFGSMANSLFFKVIFDHIHAEKGSPLKILSYNISTALNVAMYGCWSYAFICRKWLKK